MANPTPEAIQLIRAQVPNWAAETNAQIRQRLNNRNLANPTPAPLVPKPMKMEALAALVTPANLTKLETAGLAVAIVDAADSDRRERFRELVRYARVRGHITQAERDNLVTEAGATIADPTWPALVSWAEINLGRPVDAADIQAAREAG